MKFHEFEIEENIKITEQELFPRVGRHSKRLYNHCYGGGVYVLWFKDEVMYVGQTANLSSRLAVHNYNHSNWKWNYISWISCSEEYKRIMIEAMLIHNLHPVYNIACSH